jgi:hypothetical protein
MGLICSHARSRFDVVVQVAKRRNVPCLISRMEPPGRMHSDGSTKILGIKVRMSASRQLSVAVVLIAFDRGFFN